MSDPAIIRSILKGIVVNEFETMVWKRLLDHTVAIKVAMSTPLAEQLYAVAATKDGKWVLTGETITLDEVQRRSLS